MDYAWEKLLEAVRCLDAPGSLRERLTHAGLALTTSLGPEHFADAEARAKYSAIVNRLRHVEAMQVTDQGNIEITVRAMDDDEREALVREIRELARLVGVGEAGES